MGDTGIVRFPGNLDPRAQEFRPNIYATNNFTHQIPLFGPPPPPLYFSYTPPHAVPFAETAAAAVMAYAHAEPHFPTLPAYVCVVPPLPPPSNAPTRTLVLSSVPGDVSETTVRRELEVFGEVRGIQMERISDGILTVHFYDLRHAEKALKEIREQHMHHQVRLRNLFIVLAQNSLCLDQAAESFVAPVTALSPARGLIAGCAVWAQFVIPSCNAVPDGHNQGSVVVFNLGPNVTTSSLKQIFQDYGSVKEVRETPLKKQQRFVEFYDVRDAAKALREMNGKDIYGKQVVIEFSRPGGYGRKVFNAGITTAKGSSINTNKSVMNTTYYHDSKIYKFSLAQPSPPSLSQRFVSGHAPPNTPPRALFTQTHSSNAAKKGSHSCKENTSEDSIKDGVSIEALSRSDNEVGVSIIDEVGADGNPKRINTKKTQNCQSIATAATTSKQQHKSKLWKGRQGKKFNTRFLINEIAMMASNCGETRTTVMIKNIPNKYSQKLLLSMLDNHCIHYNEQIADEDDQPLSSYDFVYLPIDFNNKCNVGYGFVNMSSPQATWRLYKAFHHQHWEVFNSRKICEVTYARIQGLEALKEHFKNSKFPCELDHYMPVVFSPPRDGRQLTEPLPIVGHKPINQVAEGIVLGHPVKSTGYLLDGGHGPQSSHDDSTDGREEEDEAEDLMLNCMASNSSNSCLNGGDCGDDDKDSVVE